jgi:FtsP/CotA-like multicopper oxidase with cupredoxin domain
MAAATTMGMTWVPTRAGNWLFHCHLIAHIAPAIRNHYKELGGEETRHEMNHAYAGMAGLVSGITVTPRRNATVTSNQPATRALRLFVHKRAQYLGAAAGYGFILQEGAAPPAPDSIRIPGSPIVLRRGEPVSITVLNRTNELVSVHWHGIEVESYYDGVADWSGDEGHTAPRIAPGDSFVVRLMPDRAGTFIYHTHQDEGVQLSSGLYGPFVVLAPGEVRDTITDRIFLIGRSGLLLRYSMAPRPRVRWSGKRVSPIACGSSTSPRTMSKRSPSRAIRASCSGARSPKTGQSCLLSRRLPGPRACAWVRARPTTSNSRPARPLTSR